MNEFVTALYVFVAIPGALLLMYVIFQAINDLHLNRTDHPSVIKARKFAFVADAIFLTLTVRFRELWLVDPVTGLIAIGMVGSGILILSVNVISLHMRAPPQNQSGFRVSNSHSWWKPRRG